MILTPKKRNGYIKNKNREIKKKIDFFLFSICESQ